MDSTEKSSKYEDLVNEIGCTLRQKNDEILALGEEIKILKEQLKETVSNQPESQE